ncbi:alpha-ribazole phosphatase [Clostridium sp. JNZ J1-5]
MTSLYLVRHGEAELNNENVYFGWTDCYLTERGINQCRKLSEDFKNIKFDIVISSPLKRALDSVKIIIGLDQDILLYEEFKEINFGKWEGLNFKEIRKVYEKEWELWSNNWKCYAPPEGESFLNLYNRVRLGLEVLLDKYKDKKILVVAHGGTLKIILMILLKLDYDSFWNFTFDHGAYTLFEITESSCVLRNLNK